MAAIHAPHKDVGLHISSLVSLWQILNTDGRALRDDDVLQVSLHTAKVLRAYSLGPVRRHTQLKEMPAFKVTV